MRRAASTIGAAISHYGSFKCAHNHLTEMMRCVAQETDDRDFRLFNARSSKGKFYSSGNFFVANGQA